MQRRVLWRHYGFDDAQLYGAVHCRLQLLARIDNADTLRVHCRKLPGDKFDKRYHLQTLSRYVLPKSLSLRCTVHGVSIRPCGVTVQNIVPVFAFV